MLVTQHITSECCARHAATCVQAGDVLLLDTGAQFQQNHHNDRNFALVAEVADSRPPRFDRVAIAVVVAIAAIVAAIAGFELFVGAALAGGIMLLTGCLGGDAARAAVKWDVLVTIAAAFGISNAMENTGAPPNMQLPPMRVICSKEAPPL